MPYPANQSISLAGQVKRLLHTTSTTPTTPLPPEHICILLHEVCPGLAAQQGGPQVLHHQLSAAAATFATLAGAATWLEAHLRCGAAHQCQLAVVLNACLGEQMTCSSRWGRQGGMGTGGGKERQAAAAGVADGKSHSDKACGHAA